jgi:hypothetical protein
MAIDTSPHVLRRLEIASPCTVSWDGMRGDDKVRFCGKCQLNVYNLSGMSRREAERVVGAREGRVCVRFYRRPDGTVMTRDCGAKAALVARRLARLLFAAACVFALGVVTGSMAGVGSWLTQVRWPWHRTPVVRPLMGEIAEMGDVAAPAPLMGKVAAPTAVAPDEPSSD